MSYRGYNAKVEFDPEDNILFGYVLGVPESITFHGETVAQLTEGFHASIDHYISDCEATGRKPYKPYSGKLMLRVSPDVSMSMLQ